MFDTVYYSEFADRRSTLYTKHRFHGHAFWEPFLLNIVPKGFKVL